MKNVWETCKFSDEIINGQLEIAKFAVELHSILDGTADKSYLDAETFLDNTYVTDAIELVLTNSFNSDFADEYAFGALTDDDTHAIDEIHTIEP